MEDVFKTIGEIFNPNGLSGQEIADKLFKNIQPMETIQSKEQLIGICQALYYANVYLGEPIEDEKEFSIDVKQIQPYQFQVTVSYIDYFIESEYENDEHEKHRCCYQTYIVNVGMGIYKLVKDIISDLESIYNKDLPEVKSKIELKEIYNS